MTRSSGFIKPFCGDQCQVKGATGRQQQECPGLSMKETLILAKDREEWWWCTTVSRESQRVDTRPITIVSLRPVRGNEPPACDITSQCWGLYHPVQIFCCSLSNSTVWSTKCYNLLVLWLVTSQKRHGNLSQMALFMRTILLSRQVNSNIC